MKSVLVILGGLLAVVVVAVGVYYLTDSGQRIETLRDGGTLAETSAGPVEYQLTGSGDGNVLLFFHGTPGGYDQGLGTDTSTRVLSISRPGYLGTPLSTGATPEQQASAAAALLDELGIEQVRVMGASGGGPAAYTFAAKYPERTLGLVAMEAISQSMPADEVGLPSSDFVFWLMIQSLVLTQDTEGVVSQIAQNEADRARLAQQPEQQARVADMIWSVWPPSMRKEGFDNDFTQFQNLALPLEAIRVPTLVVHGTDDQAVPFEHAEHAVGRIAQAQLHAIEGAGHMMPFAHEAEVNDAVTEFFNNLAVRSAP